MANNNIVALQSSDGEIFQVVEPVALQMKVVNMAKYSESPILLPNVSSRILKMVIHYCKFHVLDAPHAAADTVKRWDAEFVKQSPSLQWLPTNWRCTAYWNWHLKLLLTLLLGKPLKSFAGYWTSRTTFLRKRKQRSGVKISGLLTWSIQIISHLFFYN